MQDKMRGNGCKFGATGSSIVINVEIYIYLRDIVINNRGANVYKRCNQNLAP